MANFDHLRFDVEQFQLLPTLISLGVNEFALDTDDQQISFLLQLIKVQLQLKHADALFFRLDVVILSLGYVTKRTHFIGHRRVVVARCGCLCNAQLQVGAFRISVQLGAGHQILDSIAVQRGRCGQPTVGVGQLFLDIGTS